MDRLAVACLRKDDLNLALDLIEETISLIESEPKLQDPDFRATSNLRDMMRMILGEAKTQTDIDRAQNVTKRFNDFVQSLESKKSKTK